MVCMVSQIPYGVGTIKSCDRNNRVLAGLIQEGSEMHQPTELDIHQLCRSIAHIASCRAFECIHGLAG